MTAAKRLIVNADDFGRTAGINRGIALGHRDGIVTSATLMVNHPAAAEAASLAKEHPGLGVGLHVALTGGPPALPPARIPTVVDERGQLPSKPEGLARADPRQVLDEARAQLLRFRELLGRDPTHFDSHHHSHTVSSVLEALVTLAWETGLPVRSTTAAMRERLKLEGIPTADAFVDRFFGEGATLENLVNILGELGAGTTELMCHPAVIDEELKAGSSYTEPRARELAALTHREARQILQAAGVRLIHYGAL
jgi:predicted glycoside hydrolase/deacetylase ChbG (UPF0249 family)